MATFSGGTGQGAPATLSGRATRTGPGAGPAPGQGDVSGTPETRSPSLGPPIDGAWWKATAGDLLRRLPRVAGGVPGAGAGAGEGPNPDVVDALASQLARVMAPVELRAYADEETYLRAVLDVPSGSTEQLREAIVQRMAPAMSSAVTALNASVVAGGRAARPSPIALPPPRGGPPMGRRPPVIRLCADEDERFLRFQAARVMTQANIAGALGRGTTADDVEREVPREEARWQSWYLVADAIGTAASGQDLLDDFYNCLPKGNPTGPGIGRGSTQRLGIAVHNELQRRYLRARPYQANELVIERAWYGPWRPGRQSRPRGRDLIRERASERLDTVGALSWSLGASETPHRVDIGDLTNLTLHEIKPVRGYGLGVLQLWQYVHNHNLSKFFDEQSAGATDVGERMRPGGPLPSILAPIRISRVLPDASAWEKRWVAHPWMLDVVPGVIAYTLLPADGQGSGADERIPELLRTAIRIAVAAVLGALAVAAIWAVAAAAPAMLAIAQSTAAAALETGSAMLVAGGTTLELGLQPIWEAAGGTGFGELVTRSAMRLGSGL